MRVYLSAEQLIEINFEMAEMFGGMSGVRDRASLEAAAARPQNGYYKDVVEEGAALCRDRRMPLVPF